jgi:hypothetical protein
MRTEFSCKILERTRTWFSPYGAWLNPPDLPEKDLQKRTPTNLYNARPDWLAAAYNRLDAAVCTAYGWPEDLADEEILARLLALNLARAG